MKSETHMNNMILWMILVAMWGSSYAAIKVGIEGLSPVVLVAGRLWIGAAILYLVLKLSGGRLASRKRDWFHYAFSGLLGSAVPFFLISYGEQSVDSALAAIFMGIAPVVTAAIAAAVFPDEKLSGRIVLGLVCGFGGVVMLVGPSALGQVGQNSTAQAAILAAALCYAGTTVYVRRFVKGPALATATGATLVAALATTAPAVTSVVTQSAIAGTSALLAMVYLGVFSTAAANLIYFHLVPGWALRAWRR